MLRPIILFSCSLALMALFCPSVAATSPTFERTITERAPLADALDATTDSAGNLYAIISGGQIHTEFVGVIKVSPSGNLLWSTTGGPDPDQAFETPQSIAVSDAGRVYVVDRGADRVQYFRTTNGSYLGEFGGNCFILNDFRNECIDPDGNGPLELGDGQFFQPTDVATDGSGRVYVADFNNHRIQVFNGSGVFQFKFGSICPLNPELHNFGVGCVDPDGTGPLELGDGQFYFPNGVDVAADGRIAVADSRNERVLYFDANGQFLLKTATNRGADKVQFDPSGDLLFVADRFAGVSSNSIEVFDRSGVSINSFARNCNEPNFECDPGEVEGISGLGLTATGELLVVDADGFGTRRPNIKIKVFSLTGALLREIGNVGDSPLLAGARAADFDILGNIYIVGGSNSNIRVFSSGGEFVREINESVTALDDIAVDSTIFGTRLIVSSLSSHEVAILDSNGNLVGAVGAARGPRCNLSTGENCIDPDGAGPAEPGDGQFVNQRGISIGYSGRIYVSDTGNHRIQVFDNSGNFLFKFGRNGGDGSLGFGEGEFFNPEGIAEGADGRIYVADTRNRRIQVFDASGGFLFAFGERGPGPGQFDKPADITVDPFGRVYVVDRRDFLNFAPTADRVQVFTSDGEYVTEFGGFGIANGKFRLPSSVATGPNRTVAIADSINNRVQLFHHQVADLTLTKTGPAVAEPGSTITYELFTRNDGPDDAVNVAIRDTLPPEVTFVSANTVTGFCTEENGVQSCGQSFLGNTCAVVSGDVVCGLETLIPTASGSVDLVVQIASSTTGVVVNTATASSNTSDGVLADNTDTATTEIVDTTPPVVTVPADLLVEAEGPGGAVVVFNASASDTVDGAITPICNVESGSTFALGTTSVTCTATDNVGNSASATFDVTVVDTTPPVVTVPADQVVEAEGPQGATVSFNAVAEDIVDGALAVSCTPASNLTFALGETSVNCTATDNAGNTASAIFLVTVQDTTPPAIIVPADVIAEATGPGGANVDLPLPVVVDAVDPTPAVTLSPASLSLFPLGTTVVTVTATDAAGNSSASTFNVLMRDTTPPEITAPADIVVEGTDKNGQTVELGAPAVTDAVDANPDIGNDAPALFLLGETVVTWTATDFEGNSATDTQTVTVVDTTPPTLTVPPYVEVIATGPLTSIDIGMASADDIYGIASLTNDAPATFPVGLTEVTWTATDTNGNVTTALQLVTASYQFGGFVAPIVDGGTYKVNSVLPIRVTITYRNGTFVSGLAPTIAVFMLSGGEPSGDPVDVDAVGPASSGNVLIERNGVYTYNLSTQGYSPGAYRINIDFGDDTLPDYIDIFLK